MGSKANDTDGKKKRGDGSKTSHAAKGVFSTIKDVRNLIELMVENGLCELEIDEGRRKIVLKRGQLTEAVGLAAPAAAAAPAPAAEPPAEQEPQEDSLTAVTSPMVGTFYAAAGPDSEPYIAVGDIIGAEDVVGVVEAMKVMNEIKAGCAGTVAEICVQNAQPVEFGQALFRVKSA